KLSLVVPFEVEPLLPVSKEEMVIDFIITNENAAEKQSTLVVAAAQEALVLQHVQLLEQAGIHPTRISVDLFGLYALYTLIPLYKESQESTVLIDFGMHQTRLLFVHNRMLKLMRTMPTGLETVIKTIA